MARSQQPGPEILVGLVPRRWTQPSGAGPPGLSKLLVGAFGTAAFALTTETIWELGDALGGLRLSVIMLLGLIALVAWLIVAHDLWEKPDKETSVELARLFNVGTILPSPWPRRCPTWCCSPGPCSPRRC